MRCLAGCIATGSLPVGFRAPWEGRHLIAAAKLASKLKGGSTLVDWQNLLLWSDGIDREKDEFVEVHLYEGFNLYSVESIAALPKRKQSKETKMDVNLALKGFAKHFAARVS